MCFYIIRANGSHNRVINTKCWPMFQETEKTFWKIWEAGSGWEKKTLDLKAVYIIDIWCNYSRLKARSLASKWFTWLVLKHALIKEICEPFVPLIQFLANFFNCSASSQNFRCACMLTRKGVEMVHTLLLSYWGYILLLKTNT
jgi:hypothetical protein